ncbi:hypothetical protein M3I01_016690 [Marinomonas sp. RSW2]|uniref:Uncharacterized protein n=1 Tax=Marinomonas maritima TaxID=2940935 RepID=A0ABT5WI67_9GAMM|nr:hypothetical protein [Marinomonas maritima]MDE8604498.1 hypothetical protein [Marinomonas maritima]
MSVSKGYVAILCLAVFCSLPVSSAEEEVSHTAAQFEKNEQIENAEPSWWLSSHETISKTIGNWSTNIDSFLSGTESSQPSDSYLDVRFGTVLSGSDSSGFFDFRTRLKLPDTQDRLRLVIESEPDSLAPESLRGESSQQNSIVNSALKLNISAAVRYIQEDIGLDLDAGIKVDFPLDPFLRLRLKQSDVTGSWNWWQNQEAFAYYSKGFGARYGLGLGYAMSPTLNFGTDFGVTWLDTEGLFYVRENFTIQHALNEKNRMAYQLSLLQSGEHSIEPDSFLYNIQYERLLYKDWLIGQVIPQFTHEAEDDYDGTFSLTLSLAILLGPQYLN